MRPPVNFLRAPRALYQGLHVDLRPQLSDPEDSPPPEEPVPKMEKTLLTFSDPQKGQPFSASCRSSLFRMNLSNLPPQAPHLYS